MRRTGAGLLAGAAALSAAVSFAPGGAAADDGDPAADVYLVVLQGPGLSARPGPATRAAPLRELRHQDVLGRADVATEPLYHWTHALDGFAVELTEEQAATVARDPRVALVEENEVRPLAGVPGPARAVPGTGSKRGGRGAVVGIVDTGIWPESPVFADAPGLGPEPRGFFGTCRAGEDWDADTCGAKLVAAQWFVAAYGEDRLRSSATLSARDDSGHGTQMASITAGNAGVSVTLPGQRAGEYAGVAPQARVAAYKACWSAPDPEDDGCATADLVAAIDQATRDRVDVLGLAVGGPSSPDAVERALLGATEAGIVVVAAAGNDGDRAYAAHGSPWVTTVGATTTDQRRGVVGPVGLEGAMAATRDVPPARLVVAADAAAAGAGRSEARVCAPGSLDASRTAGAVVVCERGVVGRVEKSETVRLADGVGMVLLNTSPGTVEADLHALPTVHLSTAAGRELVRWHRDHPQRRVRLRPLGVRETPSRVTPWSTSGDPSAAAVKPDVVAPAVGILGAVPPAPDGSRWAFVTGSSAAAAWTAGQALRLVAAHPSWPTDQVRSALATTARSVAGSPTALREGAGLPSARRASRAALAYRVGAGDYRRWLVRPRGLNTPSVQLTGEAQSARRTVTNVTGRTLTVSAAVEGFTHHAVTVRPATLTLRPRRSATFRVVILHHEAGIHPLDDGWLTWSGRAVRSRIPVVLAR